LNAAFPTGWLPQSASDVKAAPLPESLLRKSSLRLPELSETEFSRHYSELEQQVYGVNDGFYPLGSCTMKTTPPSTSRRVAEGFKAVHPLQR
jgi:glycine dehydrogenase subunit 2